MLNKPSTYRLTSIAVIVALTAGACAPLGETTTSVLGWCPNIPGQELYRGGQVYGDENGNPIQIRLDRNAIVTPTGSNYYSVTEGQTMYAPDDGQINLQEWEEMTAMGPEALQSPYSHYAKYGTSAEPAYPDHLRACVDRRGTIVLAQETLFPLNTKDADTKWLKAEISESITQAEARMDSRRYPGGSERRG